MAQELHDSQEGLPQSERLSQQDIEALVQNSVEGRAEIAELQAAQEEADQESIAEARDRANERAIPVDAKEFNNKSKGRPGAGSIAPLQFGLLKSAEWIGKTLNETPDEILTTTENTGSDILNKHDPWSKALAKIPFLGRPFKWMRGKASKSFKELRAEFKKKFEKKIKEKQVEASEEKDLVKSLKAAGVKNPEKAAKAIMADRKKKDTRKKNEAESGEQPKKPEGEGGDDTSKESADTSDSAGDAAA